MSRSLVINVDADGVIYEMVDAFSALSGLTLDESRWDLGLGHDFLGPFNEAVEHGLFVFGKPIPGAIEGLLALIEAGHRVRIISDKTLTTPNLTKIARRDMLNWLSSNGLDQIELAFTGPTFGKSAYPADVVIDDKPDLSWRQVGAMNILFDQPWNREVDVWAEGLGRVHRCAGWDVVLERVGNEFGVVA